MIGAKLYVASPCPYCHKAAIAAAEKSLKYEKVEVELGEKMPDWYKKLNPNETVPTLQLASGKLVFESNLVAQFFDNSAAPKGTLMGATPYQRHKVEFFLSQVGDLTGAMYGLLRDPYNAEKRKYLDDNLVYIENLIGEVQRTGPYYLDDAFSMADISILPFLIRFKTVLMYYAGYDLFAKAPRLKAMWVAGSARPSVSKEVLSPQAYIAFYAKFLPKDFPLLGVGEKHILYASKMCPFAARARLACAVKKFEHHYIEVPIHPHPQWLSYINFRETVPVLMTPAGEPVYESQLVVNYIDQITSTGANAKDALIPRLDAEGEYAVSFFITNVGYFIGAMFGFMENTASKEAKEELQWAAQQLTDLLAAAPFGAGPFLGGARMNAGDIALLPFLHRIKVFTKERMGGYDLLTAYPRLKALLEAGLTSEAGKSVFLADQVYIDFWKKTGH